MTEILIYQSSLDRISAELAQRFPNVTPISWHPTDGLLRDGAPVAAESVAPEAGWISIDVLQDGHMSTYCEALQTFPTMRWAQTLNAGLDMPVYPALAAKGIRLSKSSAQSLPIAEYALAYALHHFQGIEERAAQQRSKVWKIERFREIAQSNWLIVGFGHIGRGVAKRARAFDANIIAVRHSQTVDPLADKTIRLDQVAEHLPEADVVVLACPHNEQTDKMADASFFSALKEGALLINVARGGLVVEEALIAGLAKNRPARAILDVFMTEPLPQDDPLWNHPQVTVTAHTSNAGAGTMNRGDLQFLENLDRLLKGTTLLDEVPPELIV
ncbi:MAG: D-2-hydroxyacid dehydrogenase [Gammaproteobacteria bacterium]|nr:D-2-hydroxyacid dehydrogenase [Gammaproteobacteria bacterium]